MEAGEREFRFLLFETIRPGDRAHAQSAFKNEPLTHLNTVLQILRQAAETDHLELPRWVFRPKAIQTHLHLSDGHLVVLGVTDRRCLEHFHLNQAVIHVRCAAEGSILPHTCWRGQPHA